MPGGGGKREDGTPFGTRKEMDNEVLLEWLNKLAPQTEHILSVCTGALPLAKAGLVEKLAATTHHLAFDELRRVAPNADIREGERVVDSGKLIFSGGISAGIDASFYLIASLLGEEAAWETARYMEYDWSGRQHG